MSLFSTILSKLGLGDHAVPSVSPPPTGGAPSVPAPSTPAPAAGATAPPATAAISQVDVVSKLEAMAKQHGETLNWKTSIVDLLKLLGLDSSLGSRKELAAELGCPADKMGDSAQMNTWLHQSVLKKLAENGGNIPADLLH